MEREWSGHARRVSRVDRAQIESLIRAGATFEATAGAVGCSTKSIQRFLAFTGGLRSRLKERSALRLSLAEREELWRGLVAGESLRRIARRLAKGPFGLGAVIGLAIPPGERWRAVPSGLPVVVAPMHRGSFRISFSFAFWQSPRHTE